MLTITFFIDHQRDRGRVFPRIKCIIELTGGVTASKNYCNIIDCRIIFHVFSTSLFNYITSLHYIWHRISTWFSIRQPLIWLPRSIWRSHLMMIKILHVVQENSRIILTWKCCQYDIRQSVKGILTPSNPNIRIFDVKSNPRFVLEYSNIWHREWELRM